MNERRPLRAGPSACERRGERRRAAARDAPPPRALAPPAAAGRSAARAAAERRRAARASRRAAAPAPRPPASSRCQTAKSAYWTGSSGSGDGRPGANARVERRQLADQDAQRPAVGDDVVQGQQQQVLVARPAAAARRAAAGRAREVERPARLLGGEPPRSRAPGRPRQGRRGRPAGRGRADAGDDHLDRPPAARREAWCAAPRAGARSRRGPRRAPAASSGPVSRTAAGML